MARVTVSESQKNLGKQKGLRMFSFDPGKLYHVLFLGEELGGKDEPIMYLNYTHNVKKDGKGFEVRCANQDYNLDDVSVRDESGEIVIDPRTGKAVNDGTCPYCEVRDLHTKYVFQKRKEWIEENPAATEDQIKAQTRKLFQTVPVTEPTKRRVLLTAIFELDDKKKLVKDEEGNPKYSIMGMRFTENQFNKKLLEQAEIRKMNLEEDDDGLAWHEYYFNYPKSDNKMISGKDMSITPVANELARNNPGLKAKLEEEIVNLNLDELEEMMLVFKLKTLEQMERDIAPLKSRITEDMSDEDIQDALDELGEEDIISDEEASKLMGKEKFSTEVTNEDIENLM